MMPQPQEKLPADTRPPRPPLTPPVNWQAWMWYLPTMLITLWLWQEVFYTMAIKTIPYSEFKQHVAERTVTECDIRADEIDGLIRIPKPEGTKPTTVGTAPTDDRSPTSPATDPPTSPPAESTTTKGAAQPSDHKAKPAADKPPASASPPAAKEFMFRTVLADHRDNLESVARELLIHETIDAATFRRLLDTPGPPTPAS